MALQCNKDFPGKLPKYIGLGNTVRLLMKQAKTSEADLCRGINLPQTTINRVLSGQTEDPRISTILAIARFYGVTVEQLFGKEPLITCNVGKNCKGSTIPLINWDSIKSWLDNKEIVYIDSNYKWLKSERQLGIKSFAVYTHPTIEDFFGNNRILLIDTNLKNSLKDGIIVLLNNSGNGFVLRQIVKDGEKIYLRNLFEQSNIMPLQDVSLIKGFVSESRKIWHTSLIDNERDI